MNYQEVLRELSQSVVRLKKPERLLKMITRYLDKELKVSHAGILVVSDQKGHYTFVDSKGPERIPRNLLKFETDHPLVQWFQPKLKQHRYSFENYVSLTAMNKKIQKAEAESHRSGSLERMKTLRKALEDLRTELVIPAYDKKHLIGLLMLGPRRKGKGFEHDEIAFFQVLTQDCSIAVKSAEYQRHLMQQKKQLQDQLAEIKSLRAKENSTYYEIIRSLVQQVYAKDPYTFGHISQVERLGMMTAKELDLIKDDRTSATFSAGLVLHDLGKIGIPDHILNKPGPLDDEEWAIMKTHVDKGASILEPLTDFQEVREIVFSHHEKYDGTGYPRKLKAEEIPIGARIVSVVDAFHAIVSTRCYSKGRPTEFAFQELRRCAGTQFDPVVVEAFIGGMQKRRAESGNYPSELDREEEDNTFSEPLFA